MSAKYSLESDLELALELAVLADEITMARFLAQDLIVSTKPETLQLLMPIKRLKKLCANT